MVRWFIMRCWKYDVIHTFAIKKNLVLYIYLQLTKEINKPILVRIGHVYCGWIDRDKEIKYNISLCVCSRQ